MNRFYRLLAYGYFPKELPPIFSTCLFAKHVYNLAYVLRYTDKTWQRSCAYLLQVKPYYKRRLDIISPQSMLKQAYLISKNYTELQGIFTSFDGDCSRPVFNRKTKFQRAVRPFAMGRGYEQRKLQLSSRFPVILKLDVKSYYRSIYTHSIAWAIHGKGYAKTHFRENNLGNKLDKAFQQSQDGQTIGIPTGPDTSFIISEVIMSKIIKDMIGNNKIKSDRFVRYYDDIQYGCENEEEAHRVLSSFEDALRDFELEVNPKKVQIIFGLQSIEHPWLFQLRALEWRKNIKTDVLMEIFSFVMEIAQRYPEDHVLRYFLRKMNTVSVAEEAWEPYQRILLALLQDNRGNTKEVFEQFAKYHCIGWQVNKRALKEALDGKVMRQLHIGVTSELSWAIYGYLLFDLRMSKDLASKILQKGDIPSKILVTKLIYDKDMALKSEVCGIVKSWDDNVLNSSEWLFAYEVLVNKWHNRYSRVLLPKNKILFEYLKDQQVSFLEETKMGVIDVISTSEVEGETSDDEVDSTVY